MPVPTAQEVLMWQLINRARLDPVAEAARYGIDLNEGLAAGTLAAGSRQPLAFSNALFVAADGHSQAMIDADFFAHTNPNTGSTPQSRATAAGYAGQAGENIVWSGSTGGINATTMIFDEHESLFVDDFVSGRGHRINILSDSYQEVGAGQVIGLFTYQSTTYNTSMVTEDFGIPTTQGQFLTGVFYNDTDSNNFYSVGEGLGAVNVSFTGGGTASEAAGNYSTRIAAGASTVTFSGGGLATSAVASITMTSLRNAEVDVQVNGGVNTLRTSTSLTEISGVGHIVGLGTIGLTLGGDANNDVIDGTSGGDTIYGGAGSDTLNGNDGNDTLVGNADVFAQQADTLNGGNGDDIISGEFTDTVNGGAGTDYLYGVNAYDWNINLGTTSIEWMSAGFGNDTINAATQTVGVIVFGNGGNDIITGSGFNDTLWAGAGNDTVNGGTGDDVIVGEGGADALSGGDGNDQIYTDGADTSLDGGNGTDALHIIGGSGMTVNLATTHFEWVIDYAGGADTLNAASAGTNVVIFAGGGVDTVTGGTGDDVIVGEGGADALSGGDGNDQIYTDGVDSFLDGGIGTDALHITGGAGLAINLAATHFEWVVDYSGGNDTLDASGNTVDTVAYAGAGTDTVIGGSGNDFLWGEAGGDTVTGGLGNDTLVGGTGADHLAGGAGMDNIFANSGGGGDGAVDTIEFANNWGTDFVFDFEHGIDKLDMTGITGVHAFSDVAVSSSGGNALISFGGNKISVAGAAGQITAGDFVFDSHAGDGTGEINAVLPFDQIIGSVMPWLVTAAFDFGDDPYDASDFAELTAGGQALIAPGGPSAAAEAFSFELLNRTSGATLVKTEGEISYDTTPHKTVDYTADISGTLFGVSVTRAVAFPYGTPVTLSEMTTLLQAKLHDILLAGSQVSAADHWDKGMLCAMAYDQQAADTLETAWDGLDAATKSDITLIVTVTYGDDAFLY